MRRKHIMRCRRKKKMKRRRRRRRRRSRRKRRRRKRVSYPSDLHFFLKFSNFFLSIIMSHIFPSCPYMSHQEAAFFFLSSSFILSSTCIFFLSFSPLCYSYISLRTCSRQIIMTLIYKNYLLGCYINLRNPHYL